MRFMITATPDPDKPRGTAQLDDKLMATYMKFNEDMHRAGVLVTAEGLNPAAKGARIGVSGGKRVVLDGPFTESKELIGGFYLIDVDSLDEAIKWALKCPTGLGTDELLTVLPMTNESDIPPEALKIVREAAPEWSKTWSKKS
jgi:hypothetical protein